MRDDPETLALMCESDNVKMRTQGVLATNDERAGRPARGG